MRLHFKQPNCNIQGTWTCKGVDSSTVFSEVDLTENEWSDYDENGILIFMYDKRTSNEIIVTSQGACRYFKHREPVDKSALIQSICKGVGRSICTVL